jgi:hypothetical protein
MILITQAESFPLLSPMLNFTFTMVFGIPFQQQFIRIPLKTIYHVPFPKKKSVLMCHLLYRMKKLDLQDENVLSV